MWNHPSRLWGVTARGKRTTNVSLLLTAEQVSPESGDVGVSRSVLVRTSCQLAILLIAHHFMKQLGWSIDLLKMKVASQSPTFSGEKIYSLIFALKKGIYPC